MIAQKDLSTRSRRVSSLSDAQQPQQAASMVSHWGFDAPSATGSLQAILSASTKKPLRNSKGRMVRIGDLCTCDSSTTVRKLQGAWTLLLFLFSVFLRAMQDVVAVRSYEGRSFQLHGA